MNSAPQIYCIYYQAHIKRELCWFVTAALRSYEHISFDRTINTQESIFEFFIAPWAESHFLNVMSYFQERNLVNNLVKLPNRLKDSLQEV